MSSARIEQLFNFLEKDPNDPFILYAIAIEYLKSNPGKSKELFDQLLEKHANYLPTYYQAGKLYVSLDQTEKALKILQDGLVLANKQSNSLTIRELKNAINELNDDDF